VLKAVIPQVYRALTGAKHPFLALIDTFIAIEVSTMLKQALALSLTTKIKEQSPMSNLFQELKRRKVVRVAGVYAVVAWVLIQEAAFMATTACRLAPGGILFASTIDRTWKSFVFAIVGAEYLLKVLPRGTHQWSMFVRPFELSAALSPQGLRRRDLRGMRYLPLLHRASWCLDTRVNYIATYTHHVASERTT